MIEPVTESEPELQTGKDEEVVDPAVGVESLLNSSTDDTQKTDKKAEGKGES